jgi:dihydrofolate reductase
MSLTPVAPAPIALVVAVADNGVIGQRGALPWHLPDDLKRFKALTLGKPILMGRRTFTSIGRALPGRRNLVLTRMPHATTSPAGIEYVHSLDEARALTAGAEELCVIGGAELYALSLPLARRIYLTRVHARPSGDVTLVLPDLSAWRELERLEHLSDARHAYAMTFVTLERPT